MKVARVAPYGCAFRLSIYRSDRLMRSLNISTLIWTTLSFPDRRCLQPSQDKLVEKSEPSAPAHMNSFIKQLTAK